MSNQNPATKSITKNAPPSLNITLANTSHHSQQHNRQHRVSWGGIPPTKSSASISFASDVGDLSSRKSGFGTVGGGENLVEISHWPALEPLVSTLRLTKPESSRWQELRYRWKNCNCFGQKWRKPLKGLDGGPPLKIDTSVLPIDFFSNYQGNIKPKSTALIALDGITTYTYEDLNNLSDKIAHLLKPIIEKELNSEHFKEFLQDLNLELCVGVAIQLSEMWVIVILSIWKLGLSYLPIRIDESPPTRRVAKTIEILQPLVFITSKSTDALNKAVSKICSVVYFEDVWKKVGVGQANNQPWTTLERSTLLRMEKMLECKRENDPCEKCSVVLHRFNGKGELMTTNVRNCTMWNRVHAEWRDFPYSKNECAAMYAAVDSHECLGQMLAPLLAGVPIAVMNPSDLLKFAQSVEKWKIQRLHIFPELLRAILGLMELLEKTPDETVFNSVKYWFCTGGSLRRELAITFFQHAPKRSQLINLYGCRDALSFVCYEKFDSLLQVKKGQYYDPLPIGRPVINTRIYILDEESCVTENSGLGEVYISGLGIVASKALNLGSFSESEDNINALIIPNPNLTIHDDPMFKVLLKTTDFGKMIYSDANKYKYFSCFRKDDPTLHLAGNEEGEAVVENYRINTNELIFHLRGLPKVKTCHVMVYRPGTQSMTILAFIVVAHRQQLTKEDVHLYLRERVPVFMLPAIIFTHGIPVKNFKINKALLVDQYQMDRMSFKDSQHKGYLAKFGEGSPELKSATVLLKVFFHCCGVGQDWVVAHMNWPLAEVNVQFTSLPRIYKELRRHGYVIELKSFFEVKTSLDILKLMVKYVEPDNFAAQTIQGNTCGQYVTEVISAKHKGEIFKLFPHSNFGSEYTNGVLYFAGVKKKQIRQTIVDIWPLISMHSYSIAVRDKTTKQLVAVLLNVDHDDKIVSNEWKAVAKRYPMKYYTELLDEIDECMRINGLTSTKVLQTLFFLVDSKLENGFKQSIQVTKLLITKAMEVAREANFEAMYMPIFDYVYSSMVAEGFDFDIIDSKQINTFETKDGAKPFGLAPDNISGTVLHKVL